MTNEGATKKIFCPEEKPAMTISRQMQSKLIYSGPEARAA